MTDRTKRPVTNEEIAALRVQGLTERAIGERVGLTRQGVMYRLGRPDCQAAMEQLAGTKMEALRNGIRALVPRALQVIQATLGNNKTPAYVRNRTALEVLRLAVLVERSDDGLNADGLPDPLAGLDALEEACAAVVGMRTENGATNAGDGPGGAIAALPAGDAVDPTSAASDAAVWPGDGSR